MSNGAPFQHQIRDAYTGARAANGDVAGGMCILQGVAFAPVFVWKKGKGRAVFPHGDAENPIVTGAGGDRGRDHDADA